MMNILRPLHAKIEKGHATLKEQSFIQVNFFFKFKLIYFLGYNKFVYILIN